MEVTVRVPPGQASVSVVGAGERHLKMIREALGVNVSSRDGVIHLSGERDAVSTARRVLERLGRDAKGGKGSIPDRATVLDTIAEEASRQRRTSAPFADAGGQDTGSNLPGPHRAVGTGGWDGRLDVYAAGRPVRPKTVNQQAYLDAIRDHDLVIAVGPAGTGKTYVAVAAAVHLLKTDRIGKIILARPAVEAGEKLGFLPGGLEAKVNPFLRPLFDALHDMMDFPTIRRFMDNDVIEVVPLAYMRGRTLNNAVIICDEAQNTTTTQMKMFLT
ncbi:MAG: PhoH family protein, partial [Planctomycetota bacterium]